MVGGLVQDEKLGRLQEETAEFEFRLFAAAHGLDGAVVKIPEPHAAEHGIDSDAEVVAVPRGDLLIKALRPCGENAEICIRRAHFSLGLFKAGEQADVLGENFFHGGIYRTHALKPTALFEVSHRTSCLSRHCARVGGQEPEEKAQNGRFSFAVPAQKADAFPFTQLKGDVLDDGVARISECDVIETDKHSFFSERDTVNMKTELTDVRRLEEKLKAATPSDCAKLTKKLVRLKADMMEK